MTSLYYDVHEETCPPKPHGIEQSVPWVYSLSQWYTDSGGTMFPEVLSRHFTIRSAHHEQRTIRHSFYFIKNRLWYMPLSPAEPLLICWCACDLTGLFAHARFLGRHAEPRRRPGPSPHSACLGSQERDVQKRGEQVRGWRGAGPSGLPRSHALP